MELKCCLFFMFVLISTTNARPRRIIPQPIPIPPKPACLPSMATPFPAIIETIDYDYCSCDCRRPVCNDQLILPPLAVELPRGLGYFPSALPLVADYFEPAVEYLTTGAYLPISSGCNCLTLAAPVCPELAPLVKPIIL